MSDYMRARRRNARWAELPENQRPTRSSGKRRSIHRLRRTGGVRPVKHGAPTVPSDGALLAGKTKFARWKAALVRFLVGKGADPAEAKAQAERRAEREKAAARSR